MRKIEDYIRHAQECRTLARTTAPSEHREQLLNMAQTWELLAQERRRELEKQGVVPVSSEEMEDAATASPESSP